MPIPVLSARFSNVDTMLPDWLAIPIRPAGGYGATICAQSDDGVDTMPWPFGPASRMPASSATAASSSSARRPLAPASAYPPVITNAARTPLRAQSRTRSAFTRTGVQTNTRSAAPSGMHSIDVCAVTPRISPPSTLVANTFPPYPWRKMLCSTTKPNFPGCDDAPATITPWGSKRAPNALVSCAFTSSRRARRPRSARRARQRAD